MNKRNLIIILPTNFENHFLDKISLICIFGNKYSELQISWKPPNILSIKLQSKSLLSNNIWEGNMQRMFVKIHPPPPPFPHLSFSCNTEVKEKCQFNSKEMLFSTN